jgi:hypothetical protein
MAVSHGEGTSGNHLTQPLTYVVLCDGPTQRCSFRVTGELRRSDHLRQVAKPDQR